MLSHKEVRSCFVGADPCMPGWLTAKIGVQVKGRTHGSAPTRLMRHY